MLHGLGHFIANLDDDIFPAPQELVRADPRLPRVADYLERGLMFQQYRGYSWCRFSCGAVDATMGSSEWTDGIWVWPEGLSHYVRAHSVILPEEFIAHALAGGDPCQPPVDSPVDFSFWIGWAGEFKQPDLRDRLERARKKASRASDQAWLDQIAEITRIHGESHETCIFSGCTHAALKERVFCSRHLPSTMDRAYFSRLFAFAMLPEVLESDDRESDGGS